LTGECIFLGCEDNIILKKGNMPFHMFGIADIPSLDQRAAARAVRFDQWHHMFAG
jgi:hypothetical protein